MKKPIAFEVTQITTGPKHHLFGYIGHALTIPWNESGRYIVSMRTDFFKRMPVMTYLICPTEAETIS